MLDPTVAIQLDNHKGALLLKLHCLVILLLFQTTLCYAQSDDSQQGAEESAGRFLLDLSYTATDSFEGNIDIYSPGFTWLIRPDVRVGVATSYVHFSPSNAIELQIDDISSHQGLSDTVFFVQYDWRERLSASPWVPDNVGINFSILAPTGNAENFLGGDTWAGSVSVSWPVTFKESWLLNPFVSYNFSFNEGPLSEHLNITEAGFGIVKLFPSKFWIGYTPSVWFNFDDNDWNYDSHFTAGKMFSTGMGIGLDWGRTKRHSSIDARDDRALLFNFYYQFGQ
jgi:hypothetical protein